MELQHQEGDIQIKAHKPVYYYRNNHGKVVVLSEDIALEQHRAHPEFLGSSEDLKRTGFNINEAIAKHLKEKVQNPQLPPDKRKFKNYGPEQVGSGVDMGQIKEQMKAEILAEMKNEVSKQKTET